MSRRRRTKPPENGADPHRLARLVRQRWATDAAQRLTLRYWGRGWWFYDVGHYELLELDDLESAVTTQVKHEFDTRPVLDRYGCVRQVTKSLVGNVVNALRSLPDIRLPKDTVQPAWLGPAPIEREYVAVKNGLVDVRALLNGEPKRLHPHTPEWFTTACLPYAYEQTATCPRWTGFLEWMFKSDAALIRFMQEWFGYCLLQDTSQHRFIALVGDGANGKSVLLEVLKNLVGPKNCSSVALEDFVERFALAATIGKLVNVVSEIGQVTKLPEGKLKAFTAGDLLTFDRKHRQPLQVNPTARLVFATNQLPRFGDRSEGMWRRLIIVPCTNVVPPDQQDRELAKKLCEELPGILNWALEGLTRLRSRGKFEVPDVSRGAVQAHRQESHPELQFFEDCCDEDSKAEVDCGELYRAYTEWSVQNYHDVMDAKVFGKALRKQFSKVGRARRRRGGKPHWVYTGVRLIP